RESRPGSSSGNDGRTAAAGSHCSSAPTSRVGVSGGSGARMDIATVDRVLTTTRVVRRRLDLSRPVERDVVERCIDDAFQAPTGSIAQGWHFVVVTDAAKRAALADLYRRAAAVVAEMYDVPVLVMACVEGRVENAGVLLQATI